MISKRTLGLLLLVTGLALPVIAYVWGQSYNALVASDGGPPNQGAMLTAYLVFLAAAAVGCLLTGAGLAVTVLSFQKFPPHAPSP